jgi:hypothetical protein
VARKRQLVLYLPKDPEDANAGTTPLGSEGEFIAALAPFNTAPDGSPHRSVGTQILHGPGIVIEYTDTQDEINQAILTVVDQDVAWPVLVRICRTLGWKMQDIDSGQVFG